MRDFSFVALGILISTGPLHAQDSSPEFQPIPGGGQVYTADVAHCLMDFTVRLVGFNRVRGSFTEWRADLFYDPAHPAQSSVSFVARVASVSTGNKLRDADLRKESFFDAARFPRMRFHSTSVTPAAGGFTVQGLLTIRDSTRRVRFPVTVLQPRAVDPFGNWRISFGAELALNRRDFGVIGPPFWNHAISDSVTIEMEISARQWNYFHLGWGAQANESLGRLLFVAADSGRLATGLTRARALAAARPDSTRAAAAWGLEIAAMRRAQQRHLDDARQILEFAADIVQASPQRRSRVLARLGEVYLRMDRPADAARALRDAEAANPDNTFARELMARVPS